MRLRRRAASGPAQGSGATLWDRVADLVMERPARVLALSLLVMTLPLLALPFLRPTHDILSSLPPSAESVRGLDALSAHLPAGETSPVVLVINSDAPVWDPAAFRALGDASRNLRRLPGVASVRSAAMPTDGRRPDVDPALAGEAADLQGRLNDAAAGAAQIAAGTAQLEAALREIDRRLPELEGGLREARDGAAALHEGVVSARDGVTQIRQGLAQLSAGVAQARNGAQRLRVEVAEPTARNLDDAVDALDGFTIGRTDPRYREAYEAVGEAYARVTGRYPLGHPQAGQQIDPGYPGLAESLALLADGLGDAGDGIGELDTGLARLGDGLGEAAGGLRRLRDGLGDAGEGVADLRAGVAEMLQGVATQLRPGAEQLAAGLQEGAEAIDASQLADLLLGGDGPFVLTAGMLDATPELRDRLGFFIDDTGTRTRIFLGLDADPFSDEAIAVVRQATDVARTSLLDSPLADAEVLATGSPAFVAEIDRAAAEDFPLILAAVITGVFLVLVVLLRSLVAPLYMVGTVLLSYASALGITTIVFQGLLGQPGIHWWIPSLLFVLLVALGVDYSIFLMGRVREEAQRRITRIAVGEGVRHTGKVITSAGIILAGTFSALIPAPLGSLTQLGFAAMTGILLDTFIVRALLVPSLAVLLGRWNWWPSARAAAD